MIQRFLNSQAKSISSASLILAASYLASAFLGLFRDRLLAGTFGAGNELDVYYTAFTVPDFIALILIFGAISAAVIPIFSSYIIKSKEQAWEYVSALFNIFLGFLILVCIVLIIFTPLIISLVAPGFSGDKKEMAVLLMRIMFLSPIILGASNMISGILQVFHRFLVTALAPVMYNLGIITGILFFVPKFGISGLAWGVVLGGVLHLAIQVPAFIFSGFKYKLNFNFRHEGVIKTIKLMAPRSLGLAAGQLNTIVITAIASTLMAGSIAVFNLANNLSAILVNTVALSLSTAIFPSMSMAFLQAEEEKFVQMFFRLEGVKNLDVVCLALSYSVSVILQVSLLLYMLYKKFPNLKVKEISDSLQKIIIASVIMALSTFLIRQLLGSSVSLQTFWGIFFQLVLSGIAGIAIYTAATFYLKSQELKTISDSFLKKFLYPDK